MTGSPVRLDDRLWFPDPRQAVAAGPCKGLVAVGGDLSVPRLTLGYRTGLFPWSCDPVSWWSPDPRGVIELDGFHLPRSLRTLLRRDPFEVSFDRAFQDVITACSELGPARDATWIAPAFIQAYTRLYQAGLAHSVECWEDGALVGGVYGVALGGLFAGESMFHRVTGASKVALCALVQRLREQGFVLFDAQMVTPLTRLLGAIEIPRSEYLQRLAAAVDLAVSFQPARSPA